MLCWEGDEVLTIVLFKHTPLFIPMLFLFWIFAGMVFITTIWFYNNKIEDRAVWLLKQCEATLRVLLQAGKM